LSCSCAAFNPSRALPGLLLALRHALLALVQHAQFAFETLFLLPQALLRLIQLRAPLLRFLQQLLLQAVALCLALEFRRTPRIVGFGARCREYSRGFIFCGAPGRLCPSHLQCATAE